MLSKINHKNNTPEHFRRNRCCNSNNVIPPPQLLPYNTTIRHCNSSDSRSTCQSNSAGHQPSPIIGFYFLVRHPQLRKLLASIGILHLFLGLILFSVFNPINLIQKRVQPTYSIINTWPVTH